MPSCCRLIRIPVSCKFALRLWRMCTAGLGDEIASDLRSSERTTRRQHNGAHTGRDLRGDMQVVIRHASPADAPTCGQICYEAFATIVDRHGFPSDMPSAKAAHGQLSTLVDDPRFFGVVAETGGTVVGSNFLDERSTIYSVGP